MTDPQQRRLALGDELAVLLHGAGMSGRQFAASVGWQASKVSRILNGKQAVTDADIITWCKATGVSAAESQRLRSVLRSIRVEEMRWARQLDAGHRALQEDMDAAEHSAARIRVVDVTLIPGLVQTGEYAAELFRSLATVRQSTPDTDAAVRARMQRQQVLYDSTKTIELLVAEVALLYPVGDATVMRGQIDRLLAVQGLPSVRFGVLPVGVSLPVPLLHGFYILDEHVMVETLHREVPADDPEDVALYGRIADTLWSVAAEGDDARAILLECARRWAKG